MGNHSKLICDYRHLKDVHDLSYLCWDNYSNNTSLPCFPQTFDDYFGIKLFAVFWILLNMVFGVGGNLLTLCAIPYAVRKKRRVILVLATTILAPLN